MKTKSITIYQKEGLRDWLLQQPIKEVVAKLMYVLTPEQMLLLIKLHGIKIVEPKPAKQRTKKSSKPMLHSIEIVEPTKKSSKPMLHSIRIVEPKQRTKKKPKPTKRSVRKRK